MNNTELTIDQELTSEVLKEIAGGYTWKVEEGECFMGRKKQRGKDSINKGKLQDKGKRNTQLYRFWKNSLLLNT